MEDHKDPIQYWTKEEDEEVWQNIFRATRSNDRRKRAKKIALRSTFATITIFLCIVGYFSLMPSTFTAGTKNTQIVLSDKSEVTLYRGATLIEKNYFWKSTRDIYLQGNALFKVSKNKNRPFIVHSKGYETKVLGTIFKVVQSGKSFTIDLYEGKVLVYKQDKPQELFELKPKETFSNMGIAQAATVYPTNKDAEKGAKNLASLVFNECTLGNLVQVIEHTYDIKIILPVELADVKITITSKNTTAKEIMHAIALQLNLNLKEINDRTIKLEK